MTSFQKAIKYCAMAFAVFLAVSIIGSIVSSLLGLSFIFGDRNAVGEMQNYTVSENIAELKIDISAAELEIVSGDAFSVESNLENLTVKEKDGKLIIEEKSKFFNTSFNEAFLRITIPADFVFGNASVITGAGKVSIDNLSADTVALELGAGEVIIDNLIAAQKAEIDGGAGKVSINGGELANLDLDMGVGQLNLTGKLTGSCEMDCGVGETNLTLIGSQNDYTIDLDKGLGNATMNGNSLNDDSSYGSGQNKIDIDGGVGAIKITYIQIQS